jgi:Holliday junction resolvasome RuvABC endonuclease subunit
MKILGLDLSLTSTGYVLLRDEYVEESGVKQPKPVHLGDEAGAVQRLIEFDVWIAEILEIWAPDHVAIEGYSFATHQEQTRAFAIGELGGLVKTAVAYEKIPLHIIAINTWKKAMCGKVLKKAEVPLELYKRYGIEFKSQDTLEAWAVAMCYRRQVLGQLAPEPKPKSKLAIVQDVLL